jgi:hypothetical protein
VILIPGHVERTAFGAQEAGQGSSRPHAHAQIYTHACTHSHSHTVACTPVSTLTALAAHMLTRKHTLMHARIHTVTFAESQKVVRHVMNPKALEREKLLGFMDVDTREWYPHICAPTKHVTINFCRSSTPSLPPFLHCHLLPSPLSLSSLSHKHLIGSMVCSRPPLAKS